MTCGVHNKYWGMPDYRAWSIQASARRMRDGRSSEVGIEDQKRSVKI